MKVNPFREIGKGTGVGLGAAAEKFGHLMAVGELKGAGELTVDRVLDGDVQHGAALVHHGVELSFHSGGVVAAGHLPHQARRRGQDHIAPGCGGDLRSGGPEQGDVSHDDLTADGELGGQSGGADGACGVAELV